MGRSLHLYDGNPAGLAVNYLPAARDILTIALASIFAMGGVVKTIVWWKSLRWALEHGPDYAKAVQNRRGDLDRYDRVRLIIAHKGRFKPCGPKSVLLLRKARLHPTKWRRVLDLTFVKTPIFIAEGAALALVASIMRTPIATVAGTLLATWICIYSLLLIIEAIVWYVIAKDYALVWGI